MRPEWLHAARRLGVAFPEHLEVLEKPRMETTHVLIRFDEKEPRWWASTAIMSDFLHGSVIAKRLGLAPGSIGNTVLGMYISLNPAGIRRQEFLERYPDVPWKKAYDFTLAHEIGHVVAGWKEATADEYGFRRLGIGQDQTAKKMREDRWYSKMKHPMDSLLEKMSR
jgi:hypothetical protein